MSKLLDGTEPFHSFCYFREAFVSISSFIAIFLFLSFVYNMLFLSPENEVEGKVFSEKNPGVSSKWILFTLSA